MWQHIYYTSSNIFTTRPFESNIFASPTLDVYPLLSLVIMAARFVVTDRDVLGGLAVVLEDDRNVHVDDDEEADDEVGEEEGDGHDGVPAVSLVTRLRISCGEK